MSPNFAARRFELDPGPHHFAAELPGLPVQEGTYVLQAGDKNRVVTFDFGFVDNRAFEARG